MGDFQRRLNRDRDNGWNGRRGRDEWEAVPRTSRSSQDNAMSVRVPNVSWDATPRGGHREDSSAWGSAPTRSWDAPTPRAARESSPDDGQYVFGIDAREWEEEQIKLDRDWYNSGEDGVAGDEEHNPLAQYDDLTSLKPVEVTHKPIVRFIAFRSHLVCLNPTLLRSLQKKVSARQAQYVCSFSILWHWVSSYTFP